LTFEHFIFINFTNKLNVYIITPDQFLLVKQKNILSENLQTSIKFNEDNIQEIYKILHIIDIHPIDNNL